MKTWTTQAERRLDEYLLERAARERLDGEEAAELKEDLRRHVFEEAEKAESESIGLMHLENILGGMDAGYRWVNETPGKPEKRGCRFWSWTFAVVLPLLVLIFEALSAFCGSVFFDPIPTWWHCGLVALVPLANGYLLKGAPWGGEMWRGAAAGVSLIVAGFYGLLFLPLIHWSLLGLLFLGAGILSLTPVLAGITTWRIGRRAGKESASPSRFRKGRLAGICAALLALIALEGPAVWTRVNVSQAISESGNAAAVSRLRFFHSERTLLKVCYEGRRGTSGGTDIARWISSAGWSTAFAGNMSSADTEAARDLFFRVTGKPFNSLKPPRGAGPGLAGGGRALEEFEFDDHLGGDEVAVRLKHLDLKESRFDGHVDSLSRIGYGEWTMVFQNRSQEPQEARCQVKLPQSGRVSRLTLWVNSEPREAAFSSVSKVKAAYKEVAIVQRRDPVLVTMVGPDTVLVQCFPVPANGEMKIRFGVTAPLDGRRWELPRILERNFGTKEGLEHAVWLQADKGFSLGKMAAVQDGPGKSLSAPLPAADAMGAGVSLTMDELPAEAPLVWCEDRFAKTEERYLIREPRKVKTEGSGKLILVIDGSVAMAPARERLAAVTGEGVITILADDGARRVTAKELAAYDFSGGRDNAPGLLAAIRAAKENGGAPIVWVHGPQAVKVSQTEALLQLIERGAVAPLIHEVEIAPGPNRLAEAIYKTGALIRGPEFSADFPAFLKDLREGTEKPGWAWRRSPTLPEGPKVWDQLARLWAAAAAEDPQQAVPEAMRPEIAARYQLVTPVSGAVALETQEQYDKHGLSPVDADAAPHVPGVPEPSTGILMIITAAAALLRRKRDAAA